MLQPNQRVRIQEGPFAGQTGILETITDETATVRFGEDETEPKPGAKFQYEAIRVRFDARNVVSSN